MRPFVNWMTDEHSPFSLQFFLPLCMQFPSVYRTATLLTQTGARTLGRTSRMAVHQIGVTCNCARVLWAHVCVIQCRRYTLFVNTPWQQFKEPSNDIKFCHVCLFVCFDLTVT